MEIDYYTAVLYKQFCETRGYVCNFKEIITGSNELVLKEFKEWITSIPTEEYYEYLEFLGYHNLDGAVEINKGKYDTITNNKNMFVVSPFNYTLGIENSRLYISDGMIFVKKGNKLFVPEEKKILVTHNPYNDSNILKWSSIQKRGEHDISIGFYGLTSDENYKSRVELSKILLKHMNDECELDYELDNDKYFISLNSKSKKLNLRLHK